MDSQNSPDPLNALEHVRALPWFHEVHTVSKPHIGMVKAYPPRVVGFLVLPFRPLPSLSCTD